MAKHRASGWAGYSFNTSKSTSIVGGKKPGLHVGAAPIVASIAQGIASNNSKVLPPLATEPVDKFPEVSRKKSSMVGKEKESTLKTVATHDAVAPATAICGHFTSDSTDCRYDPYR